VLVLTNASTADEERRAHLYDGAFYALTGTPESRAFRDFAFDMIREAFDPVDPMRAQDELSLDRFVEIGAALKPRFTHSPTAKELLRDALVSYGCAADETYFDLPKLRLVTHSNYLTSGVGYAYLAHRDVWYSCPPSQTNWWTPLNEIKSECSLAFFPQWWNRPVPNTSGGFDAFEWNAVGRATAATQVKADTRNHPTLAEPVDMGEELRIVGDPASMLIFSAAHLHATVPNTSGRTRFSIDFRTAHIDDLESGNGAPIVDSESTGTTIYDFLRADDLSPVPEDVIRRYDPEVGTGNQRGPLVFTPPGIR